MKSCEKLARMIDNKTFLFEREALHSTHQRSVSYEKLASEKC